MTADAPRKAPKEKPIEVITPPNMLKVRLGGALPKIDPATAARAQASIEALSGEFDGWMADELSKLDAVWDALKTAGRSSDDALYRRGHDIKGLAATCGYPLVSRLAATLCRMIATEALRAVAPGALIEALVNAIRVAIRDQIRTEDDPVGRALAEETEALVAQFLAGQAEKPAA